MAEWLFASGQFNIQRPDNKGNLPLHDAAVKGDVGLMELFLRKGHYRDLFHTNAALETPLFVAAGAGQKNAVAFLVNQAPDPKAYINNIDNEGYTTLHAAAGSGNAEVVEYLLAQLAQGAKETLNRKNNEGYTPLHIAACPELMYEDGVNPSADVIRVLLNSGADANILADDGSRPIDQLRLEDGACRALLFNDKVERGSLSFRFKILSDDRQRWWMS